MSAPASRPDGDFVAMRRHLSCHRDTHPIFDASGLVDAAEPVEMFRKDILSLPQAHVLTVITAIQTVSSALTFTISAEHWPISG